MGSSFTVVAENIGFSEGPVWTRDGRLLVTSISHGKIYEIASAGARAVAETGGGPNGMAEAADGSLYVTQNGGIFGSSERSETEAKPGIQRIDSGEAIYVATEGLGAPNDLCFGPDGRLYFTDPHGWAIPEKLEPGRVYSMDPDGKLHLLTERLRFGNGIAFGPDATKLFVTETFGQRVIEYELQNGALGAAREYCNLDRGCPDGMCFDESGALYVADAMGGQVQVFDGQGTRIERLECGDNALITNCCFGGPENKTLFVTDARNERVLAFEREVAGLPLFPLR